MKWKSSVKTEHSHCCVMVVGESNWQPAHYPRVQVQSQWPFLLPGSASLRSSLESPTVVLHLLMGSLALPAHGKPYLTLQWEAYPFSSRSSPRNWTTVSRIAGGSLFTNRATRESLHHKRFKWRWTVSLKALRTVQKPKSTLCLCKVKKDFWKCPPCS